MLCLKHRNSFLWHKNFIKFNIVHKSKGNVGHANEVNSDYVSEANA